MVLRIPTLFSIHRGGMVRFAPDVYQGPVLTTPLQFQNGFFFPLHSMLLILKIQMLSYVFCDSVATFGLKLRAVPCLSLPSTGVTVICHQVWFSHWFL